MENMVKTFCVVIPCYNEKKLIANLCNCIFDEFKKIPKYDCSILIADNCSNDGTREIIRKLCSNNKKVKAILNSNNFGQIRSYIHALKETNSDVVLLMNADFQDPPCLIPEFIKKYEEGFDIVVGTKKKSKTNPIIHFFRRIYYRLLKKASNTKQIENFTGFGLYDKKVVELIREVNDPYPYLRGIVAEYYSNIYQLEYVQPKRRYGKTHFKFSGLYDLAMLGFTSYSSFLLRLPLIFSVIIGFSSLIGFIIYLVFLIINWNISHPSILFPILCTIGFIGSLILFFIAMQGEYILRINTIVKNRPLVKEEERINFGDNKKK